MVEWLDPYPGHCYYTRGMFAECSIGGWQAELSPPSRQRAASHVPLSCTLGVRAWVSLVTGNPLSQLGKQSRALAV